MLGSAFWSDADAYSRNGRLWFCDDEWWLVEHGITTSHCDYWVHYIPALNLFVSYEREYMIGYIERNNPRVMYTPKKSNGYPTNRGYLIPLDLPGMSKFKVHDSFNGEPLLDISRGKAGKLAELHFVGTIFARDRTGKEINFAEAWQDTKGNDVQLPCGKWCQIKLDREAAKTGNLWVQTHTRTKDTNWLDM